MVVSDRVNVPVQVTPAMRIRAIVTLFRPYQWVKNPAAVVLPVMGGMVWSLPHFLHLLWAVTVFTLAATMAYIINDIEDRHRDARHPAKCHRPIASGIISVRSAVLISLMIVAALGLLVAVGPWRIAWPVGAYLVINVVYSRWLKHVSIADILIVGIGFMLRALLGMLAAGISASLWLVIGVFTAAILVSLGKRRHELLSDTERSSSHRPALSAYSTQLIDSLLLVCAGLSATSYISYLLSSSSRQPFGRVLLVLTVPVLLFGIFRYLQILLVEGGGGDPSRTLTRDRGLLIASGIWACCFTAAVYLARVPVFGHLS